MTVFDDSLISLKFTKREKNSVRDHITVTSTHVPC
jgi:hypothetical protein